MTVTDDSSSHGFDGVDADDPQNRRCIRPGDRLIEDLQELKGMSPDEIARYSGQHDKHQRRPA